MRGQGTFATGLITMALVGYLAVTAEAAPATGTRSMVTMLPPISARMAGMPASPVATSSSKLLLVPPATTPPVDVPYGVGKTLYLNGHAYDQTEIWARFTLGSAREFSDVRMAWGTVVFSVNQGPCGGPCQVVGGFRLGEPASVIGSGIGLATTSGGAVATVDCNNEPRCDRIYPISPRGRRINPAYVPSGFPDAGGLGLQSAGGRFVIQSPTVVSATETANRSFALYPGLPAVRLPYDDTYGVGQGPGWLATPSGPASCFRIAALASARTLRAQICSQTLPLVGDDGTKAVVVQAGHVRLYDTHTGLQINASASPTLPGVYEPLVWEARDRYLVYAHDGTALVIMRCFVNRLCRRAVTAHTAIGVTQIARGGDEFPWHL